MAVPPHNDLQDALILQMEGCKAWALHRARAPLPIAACGVLDFQVTSRSLPGHFQVTSR